MSGEKAGASRPFLLFFGYSASDTVIRSSSLQGKKRFYQ
jgi:hypothetical protein